MAEKETQPNPYESGKCRKDEVDQSKGFFPPGVPHPEGAEIRPPGSIGGGSYEESGRGGTASEPAASSVTPVQQPVGGPQEGSEQATPGTEEKGPAGALPPHGQWLK